VTVVISGQSTGARRVARLTAIASLAKAPGFLIPLVVGAFFGAGRETDAYFIAYGGLLLIVGAVAQPVEGAVVSFAAKAIAAGRTSAEGLVAASLRRGLLFGTIAVSLGAIVLLGGVVLSARAGLRAADVLLLYALLAPAGVCWCVAGYLSGFLVAGWELEIAAFANAFRGLGALAGAVMGAAIHALWPVALGLSAGEAARALWLKHRARCLVRSLPEGASSPDLVGFDSAAAYQMTAQGLQTGEAVIERFLVAALMVGAVSQLEYATRLISVVTIVFDGGVAPWLLARWSDANARLVLKMDWHGVLRPLAWAVVVAIAVGAAIPLGAGLGVRLLLGHTALTSGDLGVVTSLLRWLSIGYVLNMVGLCLEKLLLAQARNRTLALLSGVRAGTRLTLVATLRASLGLGAVPAAYAVTECVFLACLLVAAARSVPRLRVTAA